MVFTYQKVNKIVKQSDLVLREKNDFIYLIEKFELIFF